MTNNLGFLVNMLFNINVRTKQIIDMKIYNVTIMCSFCDERQSVKNYLFTDKFKAIQCVNHLYEKRFKPNNNKRINLFSDLYEFNPKVAFENLHTNPFSDYSEEDLYGVEEDVTLENINGVEYISRFEMHDNNDYSELNVSITETETDIPMENWNY